MSILITPTLLNSFDFFLSARQPEWKKKAWDDLIGTLQRSKPWEPSPAALKGMEFEKCVYDACESGSKKGSDLFQKVVSICRGGSFQKKAKYTITLENLEFVVYGKLDVYFAPCDRFSEGHIIDIKTTGNFDPTWGPRKYTQGWQDKIYCVATETPSFEYLVVEWKSKTEFVPYALHPIHIVHHDLEKTKEIVNSKILEFVEWTKQNEKTFGTYTALTTIFSKS